MQTSLISLAQATLLLSSAFTVLANNRLTACGPNPCVFPVSFSCEYMIQNFEFIGSCCKLQDIPATGGCRIGVGTTPGQAGGNCLWVPRCESCKEDDPILCAWEHQTQDVNNVCPDYEYDALAIQRSWLETTAPAGSPSPTGSPASMFVEPLSCAPTAAPVEDTRENPNRSSGPATNLGGTVVGVAVLVGMIGGLIV